MSPELPAKPVFFASQAELRRWLRKNHKSLDEAWVGFYKKGTGKPSISFAPPTRTASVAANADPRRS